MFQPSGFKALFFFLLICIYRDNLTQRKTQIKVVRKCLDQVKFEPPD